MLTNTRHTVLTNTQHTVLTNTRRTLIVDLQAKKKLKQDCKVGEWGEWGSCSKTCDIGVIAMNVDYKTQVTLGQIMDIVIVIILCL